MLGSLEFEKENLEFQFVEKQCEPLYDLSYEVMVDQIRKKNLRSPSQPDPFLIAFKTDIFFKVYIQIGKNLLKHNGEGKKAKIRKILP